MIVYVSMVLWIPIIYLIYSINHQEQLKTVDSNLTSGVINRIPIGYCILIFGFFAFWIGIRSYIADTSANIGYFNALPSDFDTAWKSINWNGRCPGYDVINILFKCFVSQDYQVWLMWIAILCCSCMVIGIRRYSCDFFYSAYLFITLLIFFWIINGMRQFICVSIIFAFSNWIEKGKIIRFFILIALLYTIHITAIVFIPIFFIIRRTPWKISTLLFVVFIVGITFFSDPFFHEVESTIGGAKYQGYVEQFEIDDGVNFLRFVFTAAFPVVAFIKRHTLEKYYDSIPILPICVNCSIVTASIFFIGMFTSGITVGRMPVYTEVFNMILLPYLIRLGFSDNEKRVLYPVVTIILFVYFWIKTPHYYYSTVLNINIMDAIF